MTDPTHFNNDDKIDWEVRKLQAEVDAAKRGSARGATYWVPWITALVAVGGFFLQYQDAQSRRQLAAVQLERAEFERD